MHLFQYVNHTMLRAFPLTHLAKLILWNGCLLIPFLQLFMRDEVLSHDARYFLIVVKDGESGIFDLSFRRAEAAEGLVQVESGLWLGGAIRETKNLSNGPLKWLKLR